MRSGNNRCKYAKEVTCSNDRPVAVVVVQAHSYRRVASSGPESKAGTERVFYCSVDSRNALYKTISKRMLQNWRSLPISRGARGRGQTYEICGIAKYRFFDGIIAEYWA